MRGVGHGPGVWGHAPGVVKVAAGYCFSRSIRMRSTASAWDWVAGPEASG